MGGGGAWSTYTVSGSHWAPIRIKVFTDDLDKPARHCTAPMQRRPDFAGGTVKCRKVDILSVRKKSLLLREAIPLAVKMHAERLLVRPESDVPLKVPIFTGEYCREFSIPDEHHTEGVSGADMILYAAAGPTEDSTIAWALACATNGDGRPIVGITNVGPEYIKSSAYIIRVLAHELAHALGFDLDLMNELRMVTVLNSLRGKNALVVSTNKTREKARMHYNCSTAPGIELEDEGGVGTVGSHLERRNAKDELMAGIAGAGYYTALTMSIFEDMQFYRANWGMEESMKWGRNAGCSFLNDKCVKDGVTMHPDLFCTVRKTQGLTCTSDHQALGNCLMFTYKKSFPEQFQYFGDLPKGGPLGELMDYCPFVAPYSNTNCVSGASWKMPGSRLGRNSRCLKGDSLRIGERAVGDICAEVACSNRTLRVRYLGDDAWHMCAEGETIKPNKTFTSGEIRCPPYDDVCTGVWPDV
ncbi:surface protease GP63 [Trypanosoma grayi]|uniref:surface protease GP63 n=1 Tax=Trypanosoma grayi TaxID=71804 RepID=UPI0004F4478A|nr:surface protease GP63 [Trypanosoma grayi]KEG08565.1 surface protease GP63 [Trypanosoma grayi]